MVLKTAPRWRWAVTREKPPRRSTYRRCSRGSRASQTTPQSSSRSSTKEGPSPRGRMRSPRFPWAEFDWLAAAYPTQTTNGIWSQQAFCPVCDLLDLDFCFLNMHVAAPVCHDCGHALVYCRGCLSQWNIWLPFRQFSLRFTVSSPFLPTNYLSSFLYACMVAAAKTSWCTFTAPFLVGSVLQGRHLPTYRDGDSWPNLVGIFFQCNFVHSLQVYMYMLTLGTSESRHDK